MIARQKLCCLYCPSDGGWTDEHVLQRAFGTNWVLSDDVCGACNSRFSALDSKLVKFVRDFAYVGHPDVTPLIRFLNGKVGLMLDPLSGVWYSVRVENGKPCVFPQLVWTDPIKFQFVLDGGHTDFEGARTQGERMITELGNPARLNLERTLVNAPESQPAIVRSAPSRYMLRAPTEEQIDQLEVAIRSGTLASSLRTGKADSPIAKESREQMQIRMIWDLGSITRAVAKASLNFVCAVVGSDVARLPAFDPLRDFVRNGSGDGFVRLLLGEEAKEAERSPAFVLRTERHTMVFCGINGPPVVTISLYGRPFAVVKISDAPIASPSVVTLFNYKNRTHEMFNADCQILEFLNLFDVTHRA